MVTVIVMYSSFFVNSSKCAAAVSAQAVFYPFSFNLLFLIMISVRFSAEF